ncbi:MAG: hypothetical protein KQJ78_02095 [Deltaproteobacteria bacterium]|nr:hypothetical protein [Deltaproteobacteria bacterium]
MTVPDKEAQGVLVVGGGQFGRLALRRLTPLAAKWGPLRGVIELEPEPELLDLAASLGVPVLTGPGAPLFAAALADPVPPRWTVPAVPRHLLVEWLELTLSGGGITRHDLPGAWLPALPTVWQDPERTTVVSLAEGLCPDDCPEPPERCTATGRRRGEPLYQRLAAAPTPTGVNRAVLASHQLAPGVGGILLPEVLQLRRQIAALGGAWLVATACRCHGLAHHLNLDRPVPDPARV